MIHTDSNDFIVALDKVTKNYTDGKTGITKQVIRGIDLQIPRGSFCSIIGPSGVGKSTLVQLIGGMIKPTTGGIRVDNQEVHLLEGKDMDLYHQHKIGFLWQSPRGNLFPDITVLDNILVSMQILNLPRETQLERAEELMERVSLSSRSSHRIDQLSGGEAQRAGLISVLAGRPTVLLTDEPTGELDIQSKYEILELLREFNRDFGTTIILVTHDLEIASHADYSYRMLDGTIAELVMGDTGLVQDRAEKREVISVINQFGMVRIPSKLRETRFDKKFVKFIEDEDDRVYLEPVDDEGV